MVSESLQENARKLMINNTWFFFILTPNDYAFNFSRYELIYLRLSVANVFIDKVFQNM